MPGLPDSTQEQTRLGNLLAQSQGAQGIPGQQQEIEFSNQIWKGLPEDLGMAHPLILMRELYDSGELPKKWKGKIIKKKGPIYDNIEKDVRNFLQERLSTILGVETKIKSFTEEEVN